MLDAIFDSYEGRREEVHLIFEINSWQQKEEPIIPYGYGLRRATHSNQLLIRYVKILMKLHIKNALELDLIMKFRRRMK